MPGYPQRTVFEHIWSAAQRSTTSTPLIPARRHETREIDPVVDDASIQGRLCAVEACSVLIAGSHGMYGKE
jgi:hypothetical protein